MSSTKKKPILSESLSSLVEKFSHSNVVAKMEKEYQSSPSKSISPSAIDDNSFVESVVFPDATIDSLAKDLQGKGFYNPLVVRAKKDDRYEVILGRKRLLAAKKAGIASLPCAVIDISDEEMLLMLLADIRDQRQGNVVEMALVYKALIEDYGYTQETLAKLSHQSRCQVTNILRVLRLPLSARDDLCLGKLSYGHAKAIASLPEERILEIVALVHQDHLSVREVEALAKQENAKPEKKNKPKKILEKKYKAKVKIGENKVRFRFENERDKERFLNLLLALNNKE